MLLSTVVAVALILAQGFAVWAFLKFVKTFGAYTESQRAFTKALLETNQNSLMVHESNVRLLEKIKDQQPEQVRMRA